jgi:hypothetical protein
MADLVRLEFVAGMALYVMPRQVVSARMESFRTSSTLPVSDHVRLQCMHCRHYRGEARHLEQ